MRFFRANGFDTWVKVTDVKLEIGNVATDWSAAIDDEVGMGDGVNIISSSLMDMNPEQIVEPEGVIRSGYGWAYAVNGGNLVGQTLPEQLALRRNTEYTVSFVAWAGAEEQMYVDLYPDTLPETTINLTLTPTRYTWTFYSSSPDISRCRLRFFRAGGFETWVNVVDVKLECGSVATEWSEAISDADVRH